MSQYSSQGHLEIMQQGLTEGHQLNEYSPSAGFFIARGAWAVLDGLARLTVAVASIVLLLAVFMLAAISDAKEKMDL